MEKTAQRKFLTSSALVAMVAFVALNAATIGLVPKSQEKFTAEVPLNSASEKQQEGNWVWWITRNYILNGTKADVVFMGSSQMGSALYASEAEHLNEAIDTVVHREANIASDMFNKKLGEKPSTFNLSLGGAMASDQYMMAKTLFNSEHKPKLVILGVNPRDFIDNSLPSASASDTFRYLSPYVDLGNLGSYAFPDVLSYLDWQMNKTLPTKLIGEQFKAWLPDAFLKFVPGKPDLIVAEDGTVAGSTLAKKKELPTDAGGNSDVLKAIYGNQDGVRPGLWRVVACSWGAFQDNTQEYVVRYADSNPAIYPGQKKFFEQYLSYLKDQDIKVLVVGMPSLWPNRALLPEKFWTDFRQYLSSTSTEYGAGFVDLTADERFNSKDYLDTVHLNSTGGKRLVDIVTTKISNDKKLAAAITGSTIAEKKSPAWQ